LPAESIARTSKVCALLVRRTYALGELQAAKAPASSLHWNVAGSPAENVKVADTVVVPDRGRKPRVVSGAVASIVHAYDDEAPEFPTASVGRATNV